MTSEVMASIADQIGGFFWAEEDQDGDGDEGSAGQPVAVGIAGTKAACRALAILPDIAS
ncbi:hypothetical protein [Amycolatopsis sacchari]|uniref:hypothetical protein n=1 Tax=Amycolatopsis sacchari TaxID=115433 RepID=UPI003EBD3A63